MDGAPTKKKRTWLRRTVLGALVLLVLFALCCVAIQTPPAKRFMAARVNGALATAWDAVAALNVLRFAAFVGRFYVRGPLVIDADAAEELAPTARGEA